MQDVIHYVISNKEHIFQYTVIFLYERHSYTISTNKTNQCLFYNENLLKNEIFNIHLEVEDILDTVWLPVKTEVKEHSKIL